MHRFSRAIAVAAVLALAPVLAGCSDFDLDKLDVFGLNKKKPLPGDRKPLFPEGVPGVQQGVPPELMKGYQPPPEPTPAEAEQKAAEKTAAAEQPKPRAKPKPRTRIMVGPKPGGQPADQGAWPAPPQQQAQQPQGQAQAGWPDPRQQQQPQQAQQPQAAPQAAWPAPPPAGTFSR